MNKPQSLFLATTALSAFWDKSMPLAFLGPWCLRYSERANYETLTYQILPDPWQSRQEKLKAQHYVDELHARMLPALAQIFNQVHGSNHSQRFWEIIIGSWLRSHLAVFYDRYTCLTRAYATYPEMLTIGLSDDSAVIVDTTHNYADYLATDGFNLQLYSHILRYLNIPYIKKQVNLNELLTQDPLRAMPKTKRALRFLMNKLFLLTGKANGVVLADSGITFGTLLQFFIKSNASIIPLTHFGWQQPCPATLDRAARKKFTEIEIGTSDFERCVIQLLPDYLPLVFIEFYSSLCNAVLSLKFAPKAIFSSTGWHYNDFFKYFAAIHQERGSMLCGHQHGGDYGVLAYHPSEIHETKVTDRFYTWGWESTDSARHFIPLSALKLRRTKKQTRELKNGPILYGTANSYRYLFRFIFSISLLMNYYEMQKQFLQTLSIEIQKNLQLRLFPTDWGWDRKERLQQIEPVFHFQTTTIPFSKALANCSLYLCDHISTTITESFSVNKPTLIFCNPEMWEVRDQAKPYFDELKQVGIIYDDPVLAAQALNQIYPDINAWWFDPNRQAIIKEFNQRFCNPASANLREWLHEFSQLKKIYASE